MKIDMEVVKHEMVTSSQPIEVYASHLCLITILSFTNCTQDDTLWYHEGPPELLTSRYWIADYSIPR